MSVFIYMMVVQGLPKLLNQLHVCNIETELAQSTIPPDAEKILGAAWFRVER